MAVQGQLDFIISNPPYMVDAESRMYRDGGGTLGIDLAVRIVKDGIPKLNKGGILAVYTGIPILVGGHDPFIAEIKKVIQDQKVQLLEYEEIDVDVWGEELEGKAYADVERIAVVGLILRSTST